MSGLAPEPRERLTHLTPKEQACLRLVGRHLSSKEIAAELGIAKTSVDTYCNRARAKLGVTDRYEAARLLLADRSPEWSRAGMAAAAPAEPAGAAQPEPQPATRLAAIAGVGFILVLAFATLLAGLRALEQMRPIY